MHLDLDWIEVIVDNKPQRIIQVGEAVDDVIGPMVNHLVNVHVIIDSGGKYKFRDIESDL